MHPQIKVFSDNEKQEIEKKLNQQFGIQKIQGVILRIGNEKLFLFQGDLSKEQIIRLSQKIPVERVGIYFAKQEENQPQIRLSIEGSQILSPQITKNIFEINKEQTEQWMKGQELDISIGKNEFIIISHKNDVLGTGKASAKKISNFIPKNRRLKA